MTARIRTPAQLPPHMPRCRDRWYRRVCRGILRLAGWRVLGEMPDVPRAVLIGAPHSSWWDGIWGLMMKVAIGADVRFMAKQELFVGPLGPLLRGLGGVPIDRSAAKGVVEQMVDAFTAHQTLWLGITPEGTRKQVKRWKTGFWHIARKADVPIVLVYFHYPEKTIGFGPLFHTTADVEADLDRLRRFYAPFRGKHHDV